MQHNFSLYFLFAIAQLLIGKQQTLFGHSNFKIY